jgi:putative photosynthetic complex assembly protein 2
VNGRTAVAGAAPPEPSRKASPPRDRVMLSAAAVVIGFWWVATGLIVALQRDPLTRFAAAVAATALAVAGAWLIWSQRDLRTPAAARRSMIGGALLWAWVSTAFYGGWIVGPGITGPPAAEGPSLGLALEAVLAMSHNEVASVACLFLAWALTRGAPNRLGLHILVVFWAMHQLARLNIFLGVVNPATHFLPERLAWLTEFYGPARNSPLLALSVIALSGVAAWYFHRAIRGSEPFVRYAGALLGTLVALGALEHLLLGTAWDAPLWDAFLRLRG